MSQKFDFHEGFLGECDDDDDEDGVTFEEAKQKATNHYLKRIKLYQGAMELSLEEIDQCNQRIVLLRDLTLENWNEHSLPIDELMEFEEGTKQ